MELYGGALAAFEPLAFGSLRGEPWAALERWLSVEQCHPGSRAPESTPAAVQQLRTDPGNFREVRLHQQQLQRPAGTRRKKAIGYLLPAGVVHILPVARFW